MSHQDTAATPSKLKSAVLSAIVLLAAAAIVFVIFRTEPEAKRSGARKKTPMLVEVQQAKRANHQPVLNATGTVRAERDVILRAQVAGEVRWRADGFTPGGFVNKGKVLARLDARDYQNTVAQAESAVRQAETELQRELGRQDAAKQGYELLGENLDDEKKALVLRQPQLEASKVRKQATESALRQARLDVSRTSIRSPFDAHILERVVDVGSRLGPGDPIARLVGIERYWIEVTLPLSQLRWLSFAGEGELGSQATVRNPGTWPADATRTGVVDRRLGALSESTRMARVLVTVADPLARQGDNKGKPALFIGEFLEVEIAGAPLDSVRIDRTLLRDKSTVWLMVEGKLEIRPVKVALQTKEHAFITAGIEDGDAIVVTNLSAVRPGAELRLKATP